MKSMMTRYIALLMPFVFACAGMSHDTTTVTSASPSLRASTVAGTSTASYRTFSLGQPEYAPSGYSETGLDMHRRLEPSVASALMKRGYTQVPTQGDLIATFGTGRRSVEVADESNLSPGWQAPDEIGDFVEAALVIDITDRTTNANVWHASAATRLESERDEEKTLAKFAEELTAKFPMAAQQVAKQTP